MQPLELALQELKQRLMIIQKLVYGGFGISNGKQSKALCDSVEAIVAGSVFVRLITEFSNDKTLLAKKIEEKARELCGM